MVIGSHEKVNLQFCLSYFQLEFLLLDFIVSESTWTPGSTDCMVAEKKQSFLESPQRIPGFALLKRVARESWQSVPSPGSPHQVHHWRTEAATPCLHLSVPHCPSSCSSISLAAHLLSHSNQYLLSLFLWIPTHCFIPGYFSPCSMSSKYSNPPASNLNLPLPLSIKGRA